MSDYHKSIVLGMMLLSITFMIKIVARQSMNTSDALFFGGLIVTMAIYNTVQVCREMRDLDDEE